MNVHSKNMIHLSAAELETIDQYCEKFEEQWRQDSSACISSALKECPVDLQPPLMVELLKLDIDYRNKSGHIPTPHEYISQYPDSIHAINEAFGFESDETPSPPLNDLKLVSNYEIDRFHARGGLGEIYVANDKQFDRSVAIKFPRNRTPNSSDQIRLQREAEITGRLKHPGIVPVHAAKDSGDGLPCYVMQFIEGQTLRDAAVEFHSNAVAAQAKNNKFNSWQFRRLLQRFASVCTTVAYAHDQGVIHRDIKPANIMLGKYGETFLLDWGIAKAIGQSLPAEKTSERHSKNSFSDTQMSDTDPSPGETRPGQPIGTPEYASPEQVMGHVEQHGPSSDIYSLGATLYFLLLAKRAVEVDELTNLATASALKKIVPPTAVDETVPDELNAICMTALSFDPSSRYQSANALHDDVERFLADERVSVAKANLTSQIGRWARKNPRWASGLMSGLAVGLLGVSIGAFLLNQKADELSGALTAQHQANADLKLAKDKVDDYANETLESLQTLSDRVVQRWFAKQESLTDSDKEFLNEIIKQYQDFADAQPDLQNARSVKVEGLYRISQIHMLLQNAPEASNCIREIKKLLDPLPNDANEKEMTIVATALFDDGRLDFEQGRVDIGLEKMNQSLLTFQTLCEKFPNEPGHFNLLSKAQSKLGAAYIDVKRTGDAIQLFSAAKATTATLVQLEPENMEFLSSRVAKLSNMGVALSQQNKFDEAIQEFQAVRKFNDEIEQRGLLFSDAYLASGKSTNLISLGQAYYRSKRFEEALNAYELATISCHQLIEAFPGLPNAHFHLARTHQGRSAILRMAKKYELAIEHSRLGANAANKAVQMAPTSNKLLVGRLNLQNQLAMTLSLNRSLDDAEAEYAIAADWAREHWESDRAERNLIRLANTTISLGDVQRAGGKTTEAAASFLSVIQWVSNADSQPTSDRASSVLSDASFKLAMLLVQQSKFEEAVEHIDRSIMFQAGENVLKRSMRAICMAKSDPETNLLTIKELCRSTKNANEYYFLANAAARTARFLSAVDSSDSARAIAVELLEAAYENGFFNSAENRQGVRNDSSFKAMENHEGYADFLKKLENANAAKPN